MDAPSDLTLLEETNNESIVNALGVRFGNKEIYTSVGKYTDQQSESHGNEHLK